MDASFLRGNRGRLKDSYKQHRSTSASYQAMIAGNPKAGRLMITLCLGLMLLVLASSAFVALRKRTSPQKQAPLPPHPSTLIV
jgi:hypothetical protein